MNTNKSSSVETEEIKREHADTRTTPMIWVPAVGPDVQQAEPQKDIIEQPNPAPQHSSLPALSSELSFSCVLVPRFSDHYLVGDIVDSLSVWIKQACISYGWRLDSLSVRPGYIQWVMHVPMNSNPAQFMRLIRRYTSEKIFEDFPRFKQKNISGEFWAPGNFVLTGTQLQTPEQVNEFILKTRRHQGI